MLIAPQKPEHRISGREICEEEDTRREPFSSVIKSAMCNALGIPSQHSPSFF